MLEKKVFEYEGILIEQDPHNWIVRNPAVPKSGKKAKTPGYDSSFYGSLKSALEAVFEILVKKRLSEEVSHSVQELSRKIDLVKGELLEGVLLKLDWEITIRKGG